MTPDQRHNSEPFVCHETLLNNESTTYFRRGSASLVEMLECRTHFASKTINQTPCFCPIQNPASSDSSESPVRDADYSNCTQNASVLYPLLPSRQRSPHDSASCFNSPHSALNLQPPPEVCLSVSHSPQPHRCKACTSLLLKDRTKGGGSSGHAHKHAPRSPTSLCSLRSSAAALPHVLASTPASSPNSQPMTVPPLSRRSSSSRAVFPQSFCESGDLSLLNYCLHHIVSRRTSSPTLFDRKDVNQPVHSYKETAGTFVSMAEHTDKSRSLDAPVCHTPNLNRRLLSSQLYSKGRADLLVC